MEWRCEQGQWELDEGPPVVDMFLVWLVPAEKIPDC